MTTPLPRPPHTARAQYTDWFIRLLAESVDGKLGGTVTMALIQHSAITEGDGVIRVPVPELGALSGALLIPAYLTSQGNVTAMPPIPPASIGRMIPATGVNLSLQTIGVGSLVCRAMTTPWDNGVYQGQTQQYGAQPVRGGVTINVTGIAWGAKA
jgi:hypothetical protein